MCEDFKFHTQVYVLRNLKDRIEVHFDHSQRTANFFSHMRAGGGGLREIGRALNRRSVKNTWDYLYEVIEVVDDFLTIGDNI